MPSPDVKHDFLAIFLKNCPAVIPAKLRQRVAVPAGLFQAPSFAALGNGPLQALRVWRGHPPGYLPLGAGFWRTRKFSLSLSIIITSYNNGNIK